VSQDGTDASKWLGSKLNYGDPSDSHRTVLTGLAQTMAAVGLVSADGVRQFR